MNVLHRIIASIVFVSSVFPAVGYAQSSLTGTVTNEATGRALEGASVALKGTDRAAVTDRQGVYNFENLAPGVVTLEVAYSGLDRATPSMTVLAGTANRLDVKLTAQIYALSKFVVSGEREGNAQAVTLQRLSAGVKNVVSTDAFGNLAGNPADLLVRLPGVEGATVARHGALCSHPRTEPESHDDHDGW
jgi:hypothetical protein